MSAKKDPRTGNLNKGKTKGKPSLDKPTTLKLHFVEKDMQLLKKICHDTGMNFSKVMSDALHVYASYHGKGHVYKDPNIKHKGRK